MAGVENLKKWVEWIDRGGESGKIALPLEDVTTGNAVVRAEKWRKS